MGYDVLRPSTRTNRDAVLVAALAMFWFATLLSTTGVGAMEPEPDISAIGLPISRILIRTDVKIDDIARVRLLLSIEEGDTLDHEAIRRTLLTLHGSGLVSQAEVHTRVETATVELTLVAWSHVLIDSVDFEGETQLGREDLRDLVGVRAGRPLIESQVIRSVFDIGDRLRERGFLEGYARPEIQLDSTLKRASVLFHIQRGPPATIGSIEFEGELGRFDADSLRAAMSAEVGGRYRPQRAEADRDKLQQHLLREGYRTARVRRPVRRYDWETHEIHLTYEVEAGPLVELEVVGADLRTLRREGVLPFLGPQGYDPALLNFSEAQVRRWYQSKGHHEVEVDLVVESADEELIQLLLTIDPGPVFTLRQITFAGNETFEEDVLRARMQTAPRRLLDVGSGRLVDSALTDDLRALRSFYLLQGFHDVEVGPHRLDQRGRDLDLTIPITEGDRRTVGEVSWQGVTRLREDRLAEEIPLRPGGAFHPNLADEAVNIVRARYRDQGFDSVLASVAVDWDDQRRIADISFHVLEGTQTVVRRIVVRGQQRTSPWLLRQAIDIEAGDPVSRSRLLDIQRQLYGLGIFNRVDVELAQGDLLRGERDVIVRLEEGDRHRLSFGGGYDTEDGFRGLFGYSLGNVAGRAASLHLNTVVGQREELYRLLVRQPAMGAWRFPLTYSIFRSREEETAFDAGFDGDFITEQRGAQIEADLRFETFRIPVIFTLKDVDNNAADEIDEILFDRERSQVTISSLTTAVQLDRRDSPISPTKGRNSVFQVEYAFEAFGTDENFLKLFVQQTYYFNFGSGGVVGASLRLGGIESFREDLVRPSPLIAGCGPDSIPDFWVALSERFFAGGRSTHRAYKLDTLGVLGETLFINRDETEEACVDKGLFPTGGNGLGLLNLEYRYPVAAGFWATAFYDVGNVWADWRDINWSEAKDGVGVGLGWDSPIGPLRLEIGWKLDREIGEDPYQVFLSFGSAF